MVHRLSKWSIAFPCLSSQWELEDNSIRSGIFNFQIPKCSYNNINKEESSLNNNNNNNLCFFLKSYECFKKKLLALLEKGEEKELSPKHLLCRLSALVKVVKVFETLVVDNHLQLVRKHLHLSLASSECVCVCVLHTRVRVCLLTHTQTKATSTF